MRRLSCDVAGCEKEAEPAGGVISVKVGGQYFNFRIVPEDKFEHIDLCSTHFREVRKKVYESFRE